MSNPFDAIESTGDDRAGCVACGQPFGQDRLTDAFPTVDLERVPHTRGSGRKRRARVLAVLECDACGESTEVSIGLQTADGRASVDLQTAAVLEADDLEPESGGSA